MVQGVDASHGGLQLVSHGIWDTLGIDVSVLMGANIANEVAQEMFCGATIGRLCVQYSVCGVVWFGDVRMVWCGVLKCTLHSSLYVLCHHPPPYVHTYTSSLCMGKARLLTFS